jgi:hypothetical protein
MQRQTLTHQRDAPGQNTGTSQGHLSSYLLGGAPGERHRARCKTDSRGCDTHCGGLHERQTQNLRSTGEETHRATVGSPGQTGNATTTRNQLVEKKPDGKEPRNTHHRVPSGDRSSAADVRAHEEGDGLPPVAHATKQRRPVGSKTVMIGKHTHGHTLTHRSTRRETDVHEHTRIDPALGASQGEGSGSKSRVEQPRGTAPENDQRHNGQHDTPHTEQPR